MKSVYVKTTCNDHVELSSYLYLTIKIGGLENKRKLCISDNLVFPVILQEDQSFAVEMNSHSGAVTTLASKNIHLHHTL